MAQREQLNLRLSPEWFDVLSIAAMYDDQSLADFVKVILEHQVERLRDDPDIVEVRRRKAERAAVQEGRVARIGGRRKESA